MRTYDVLKLGTIAAVLVLGFSCAQTPPPSQKPMEMRPAREALTLRLKADPQLNQYAGTSHALHLCIYQLSNPNPFNQFSMDMPGISKLLNCERFDPGVALASRIVVQPGDNLNMPIDKAEGARYVGIVAGYYSLNNQSSVRLYQIPLIEEQRGGQTVTRMAPLEIDLYLGPQAIQSSR
ncbi:MAG: type VI secretion system lipoprotein TssJ [Syntrophobacteraceae bacterium]